MVNSRFHSKLGDTAKTKLLMIKIKALWQQKPSRLVFEVDGERFSAATATNVALDADAANNNIIFTRPTGPTVKASKAIQDLTYTAVAGGTGGNSIQIEYLDTGTAGAEVVTVTSNLISVSMEDGVSTAQQILDAIEAESDATDLVTVELTGSDVAQTTQVATNLTGGANTEQYDLADILSIRRLRTKKYLVEIKGSADPVAV